MSPKLLTPLVLLVWLGPVVAFIVWRLVMGDAGEANPFYFPGLLSFPAALVVRAVGDDLVAQKRRSKAPAQGGKP